MGWKGMRGGAVETVDAGAFVHMCASVGPHIHNCVRAVADMARVCHSVLYAPANRTVRGCAA